jgi:hypothetical protein
MPSATKTGRLLPRTDIRFTTSLAREQPFRCRPTLVIPDGVLNCPFLADIVEKLRDLSRRATFVHIRVGQRSKVTAFRDQKETQMRENGEKVFASDFFNSIGATRSSVEQRSLSKFAWMRPHHRYGPGEIPRWKFHSDLLSP